MKKVISLVLTAVMLLSLVAAIPVTAEGENWAMYYDMAGQTPPTTWFEASYCYSENNGDGSDYPTYVQRVTDPTSPYYGAFDYTMTFDLNLEDYGVADDHFSDLTFTHRSDQYHVGYSFSEKAFVVYRMYNPGNNPDDGYQLYASTSYELNKDQWYEIGIQWNGYVVRMYLNGVFMLEFDFATLVVDYEQGTNDYRLYDIWQWESKAQPEKIPEDRLWLQAVDCSIYLDNFAFYSGDYSFATGTATTTYFTDGDFANAGVTDGSVRDEFAIFNRATLFQKVPYGTEKVTYDREWAANHTHNMVHDAANSTTVHCLNDGYDLWICDCGASEKRNFEAALGHLPGFTKDTPVAATEDTSGIEVRMCNRDGCYKTYTTEIPLTGDGQALHHITDGGTSIYNGYMAIADPVMIQDDGFTFSADIMTVDHADKGAAGIFAEIGGCDDHIWIGYSYYLGKFVAAKGRNIHKLAEEDIVAVSDYVYSDFTWNEWTWVRDGYYAYMYINGEKILEVYLGDDTYDLNGPNDDKDYEMGDTQMFLITSPCTEFYMDNVLVASPDFDLEHKTGIVYEYSDLNDAGKDGAYDFTLSDKKIVSMFGYTKANKAGYELSSYGRPMEAVTEVHRDMAMKVDSDYDTGSNNTYAQLWANDSTGDDAINYNDDLVANDNALALDFEYSFDFYAYDWCTDPEKLGVGSAYIGGMVNSQAKNGFIGYDFLKQQAVIGSVAGQAGGAYGADNVYANYTIEKDTWHNYKFKYYFDAAKGEYGSYILSISIDGKEVLSYVIDTAYDGLNVEFYLMIPNFVKGYLDNLTIKIGDKYYDDGYDFNNGYGTDTGGFSFGGAGWSRVDGGVAEHVYTREVYPASCETDGYTVMTCGCGDGGDYILYDQEAQGHAWGTGVVTTEPTEDAEGVMTYTCGVCGDTKTEAIAKLEPEYLPGDVNSDGRVAMTDASLLSRALSGAKLDYSSDASDVNTDGRVAATDLNYILRRLGGASIVLG